MDNEDNLDQENLLMLFNWGGDLTIKSKKLEKIKNLMARSLVSSLLNYQFLFRPFCREVLKDQFFTSIHSSSSPLPSQLKISEHENINFNLVNGGIIEASSSSSFSENTDVLNNNKNILHISQNCLRFQKMSKFVPMYTSDSDDMPKLRENLMIFDALLRRKGKWSQNERCSLLDIYSKLAVVIIQDMSKFSSPDIITSFQKLMKEQRRDEADVNNSVLWKLIQHESAGEELSTMRHLVEAYVPLQATPALQKEGDLAKLYEHAFQAKPLVDAFVENTAEEHGATALIPATLKKLLRTLQKSFSNQYAKDVNFYKLLPSKKGAGSSNKNKSQKKEKTNCQQVSFAQTLDLLRATIKCDSISQMHRVVKCFAESPKVKIIRMKYRMGALTEADKRNEELACLGDIFMNVTMTADVQNEHIFEVQIVHQKLYLTRNEINR